MFSRTAMSIGAVWAVLLVPVLCVGGVLVHECSACPSVEACSHESGCEDDPCKPVPARRIAAAHAPNDLLPLAPPPAAEIADGAHAVSRPEHPTRTYAACLHPNRYSDSGLPLLN